ncbi:MAG: YkgJ family cysteine cluster protein [Candidatus Caldatribacteriota bacterium]
MCHNKYSGGVIKFPAIAKKSFDALKENAHYTNIVQLVFEQLLKTSDPVRRAEIVHELVDHFIVSAFSNELVQKMSPCKKGCAHCCHNEVSVTEDEIDLIIQKANPIIDKDLLKKQKENFSKLSYEERKCVFLDENNSCSIYPHRPSVCRTNAVIGEPEQCIESTNLRLVNTFEADMAIYSHFLFSKKSGLLSEVLFDKLAEEE